MPEPERPRERLVRVGPGGLSDRELLALVLRTGAKGVNAVDLGANLMTVWGSAASFATARFEDLVWIEGLGGAKAASLMAAFELGRRATAGGRKSCPNHRASGSCFVGSSDTPREASRRSSTGRDEFGEQANPNDPAYKWRSRQVSIAGS